ncbi:MAG: Nif3-like dinuclear metal center hexameric protein [Bacteroidetes bacterium]|nr:MAG: Nif3-like dinuclear metal center hexameric protein [Bacteroidota bacterium]
MSIEATPIAQVVQCLEQLASPALQEGYDNAGLITGQFSWAVTGVLCSLDATEAVVEEAINKGCNLIVAHHPILFGAVKKLSGNSYVEKALVKAIKNDVALYAIHTNLDNVMLGVNHYMANALGLQQQGRRVLQPKPHGLQKLTTYVPPTHTQRVKDAIFSAGAGALGQYTNCSFEVSGTGNFRPSHQAQPFIGEPNGQQQSVAEVRIECVFPAQKQHAVVAALHAAHPYQTVAYDVVGLQNTNQEVGSGLLGQFEHPVPVGDFLKLLKHTFATPVIKHTAFCGPTVQQVALCGGAGSFLIKQAVAVGVDAFVTADLKYHEFFDANGKTLLADVGHFESEQHTITGLTAHLQANFPTFAILKSEVVTNPVQYF